MAATTTDIRRDIEALTTRIESTADELDERLARLPRAAAWAWRHKRLLAIAGTILSGALWVVGFNRRRAGELDAIPLDGSYELTISRR